MQQDTLGNEYVLLKKLGAGGYADVYKARHIVLGYIRAIRMLRERVPDESNEVYQKFLRECRVLLRLGNGCHPNIIHIYQPRLVDKTPLVEMDYVDGMDLKDYIEQQNGQVNIDEVIRMAKEIGSALAYCHRDIYKVCYDRDEDNLMDDPDDGEKVLIDDATERRLIEKYRVIHNDIQTRNIMRRNSDGMYVLLDFGLAIDGNGDVVNSSRRSKGAPEFKPPEKWDDDEPTTQGDIYSFGCVLYAMLVGKPPFPLEVKNGHVSMSALHELGLKHKSAKPAPIRRSDAPDWLLHVVERCLEKNPADRYEDAYEMYEDIRAGLEYEKQLARGGAVVPQPKIYDDEEELVVVSVRPPKELKREQQDATQPAPNLEKERQLQKELDDSRRALDGCRKELDGCKKELESSRKSCKEYKQRCEGNRSRNTWLWFLTGLALVAGAVGGVALKETLFPNKQQAEKIVQLQEQVDSLIEVNDSLQSAQNAKSPIVNKINQKKSK